MYNKTRLRILCVSGYYKPAYIYGGPTRCISVLCEAMAKAGAQVTVITTNANGPGKILDVPTSEPINVAGVKVHYFPVSWPLARIYPFYSPQLGQALKKIDGEFDVVYIPGNWGYPVYKAAKAAIGNKLPYIMCPHGSLMYKAMREKRLKKSVYLLFIERQLINSAAIIHTTSLLEEQQIKKWHFKPPVITIPNAIELTSPADLPQRGSLRCSLQIPSDSTLSLYVGRLHQKKRIDLIIDAFLYISKKVDNSHLVIVGQDDDGSGKAALEQVHRLGLTDRVHFTGLLTGLDLIKAYIDSDMLVLLSRHENFGMVVVEAMEMGMPVLLSKEIGLASEVEQVKAGFVVDAVLDKIVPAWQLILSNPELRREMGSRGKQLVEDRFTSETVANRMLDLFTSNCSDK